MAFVTLALVLVSCLIAGEESALAGGEREWPAAVRLAANGDPWPTIPERNAGSGSKAPGHAAVGRGERERGRATPRGHPDRRANCGQLSHSPGGGSDRQAELAREFLGRMQITSWISVTPNLQYIRHGGGASPPPRAGAGTLRIAFDPLLTSDVGHGQRAGYWKTGFQDLEKFVVGKDGTEP